MFPTFFLLFVALITPASTTPSEKPTRVVPNFHDLMIKTRHTTGLMHPQVTTWYLKGARERVEHAPDGASPKFSPFTASILQCDQRASIHLFLHDKTYMESISHHPEGIETERPRHDHHPPEATGPEVLVTVNAVDTGERRQIGAYEARHIKTTVTVEPGKGANTPASSAEGDSWYLDLPGLYCLIDIPRNFDMQLIGSVIMQTAGAHDRRVFKNVGIEPQGLLIEGNMTVHSGGNVIVNKTELLESSDQPLDDSLFEIPADFTQRESHAPMGLPALPGSADQ
jgi:hypothetical protein